MKCYAAVGKDKIMVGIRVTLNKVRGKENTRHSYLSIDYRVRFENERFKIMMNSILDYKNYNKKKGGK